MTHCFGLGEEAAAPESHVFGDPDPFNSTVFPTNLPAPVHSTPAPAAPPSPSPAAPSSSPAAPSLTEEQRKRMELNRQRALERKLARQQQQQTGEKLLICSGMEKRFYLHKEKSTSHIPETQ